MRKRSLDKKPKGRHHHGNLKEALVEAGVNLLREKGLEGMSLRAVARSVGVSQTAPYSHFADKRMLLAAVSAHGFRLLNTQMRRVLSNSVAPAHLVHVMAHEYVAFAYREPDLFRLMFGSWGPLDGVQSAELRETTREAFLMMRSAAAVMVTELNPDGNITSTVLAMWSLMHGLSQLLLDRMIVPEMLGWPDRKALRRADREVITEVVAGHFSLAAHARAANFRTTHFAKDKLIEGRVGAPDRLPIKS